MLHSCYFCKRDTLEAPDRQVMSVIQGQRCVLVAVCLGDCVVAMGAVSQLGGAALIGEGVTPTCHDGQPCTQFTF